MAHVFSLLDAFLIAFIWNPYTEKMREEFCDLLRLNDNACLLFYLCIVFQYLIFLEGEKHQCVVASHMAPTGDLAHNPPNCKGNKNI